MVVEEKEPETDSFKQTVMAVPPSALGLHRPFSAYENGTVMHLLLLLVLDFG